MNLDFCQLTDLPACLGELTSLTTLDVEGNTQLGSWNPYNVLGSSLHSNLERLSNLRYLNLIACGLKSLPKVRHLPVRAARTSRLRSPSLPPPPLSLPLSFSILDCAREV